MLKVFRDRKERIVPGRKGFRFKVGTYIDENGKVKDLSKWPFDHSKGHEFLDGKSMGSRLNVQVDELVGEHSKRIVWRKERYWCG